MLPLVGHRTIPLFLGSEEGAQVMVGAAGHPSLPGLEAEAVVQAPSRRRSSRSAL